ncbi:MAG: hypothetical protein KBC32_04895 [Candidatus Didemnitutus sp.]|nr:hypothetical protein [Candidatus Didemnitutus sp.]
MAAAKVAAEIKVVAAREAVVADGRAPLAIPPAAAEQMLRQSKKKPNKRPEAMAVLRTAMGSSLNVRQKKMATPVSSALTEERLRRSLAHSGYTLSPKRKNGETGVDVIAKKDGEEIHIEVIGYKKAGPARSKDFYEVFFRAISRLKDGAPKVVIACPVDFRLGLPERTAVYDIAWRRLGDAFPELHIWFIYPDRIAFDHGHWNTWFERENRKHLMRLGKIAK